MTPAGEQYQHALLKAKTAVIYGGYNSLTDVFYANIPTVVLMRGMQDEEQQAHLTRISLLNRDRLIAIKLKDIKGEDLAKLTMTDSLFKIAKTGNKSGRCSNGSQVFVRNHHQTEKAYDNSYKQIKSGNDFIRATILLNIENHGQRHFYSVTNFDAVQGEPALVDFQGISDRSKRMVGGTGLVSFHLMNHHDFPCIIHKSDGQGNVRVFHPECPLTDIRKQKQHAIVFPKSITIL